MALQDQCLLQHPGTVLSGSTLPSCGSKNNISAISSSPSFCQKHVNVHAWVANGTYENATHGTREHNKCKKNTKHEHVTKLWSAGKNKKPKKKQDNKQTCCPNSP